MVQPLKHRHNTRQQLIIDTVNKYIETQPQQYKAIVKAIKKRRKLLADEKFGQMKDKKQDDLEMRIGLSLPEPLHGLLDSILGEPRFLEEDGEFKWFAKTFPEFKIPEKL